MLRLREGDLGKGSTESKLASLPAAEINFEARAKLQPTVWTCFFQLQGRGAGMGAPGEFKISNLTMELEKAFP